MKLKDVTAFKAELRALLIKYDVFLDVDADSGSDWAGVTGLKFTVNDEKRPYEEHILSNERYLDASDLK